jgi:hypothetical protein
MKMAELQVELEDKVNIIEVLQKGLKEQKLKFEEELKKV